MQGKAADTSPCEKSPLRVRHARGALFPDAFPGWVKRDIGTLLIAHSFHALVRFGHCMGATDRSARGLLKLGRGSHIAFSLLTTVAR